MNETHQDRVLACMVPAALQPLEQRLAHSRCSVLLNGRSLFGQTHSASPTLQTGLIPVGTQAMALL